MSEKIRDGFESWCLANGYTLRPAETNCGIIIEGDYGHPTVQIAWQAWQASRSALVVELPYMAPGGDGYMYEDAYACGQHDCLAEIKSLLDADGVTYK